jgi:hypothetical protein
MRRILFHVRRSPRLFVRRISLCVCFALVSLCLTMTSLVRNGAGQRQRPSTQREVRHSIEIENLIGSAKATNSLLCRSEFRRQEMESFGPGWSGNAQLFWQPQKPKASGMLDKCIPHLAVSFKPPAPGKYELVLHYTRAPDYGHFEVFLDRQKIGQSGIRLDGYAPKVSPKAQTLGQHVLTDGSHELLVEVFESFGASKGFSVGLDRIELLPLPTGEGFKRPPTQVQKP